mmetsp:Transcript_73613/g.145891  ORF Transcript_73613/g.145891 Transcript_73613/m.145891 type:complete len:327 (-) Transcript_73613:119-1099(-)
MERAHDAWSCPWCQLASSASGWCCMPAVLVCIPIVVPHTSAMPLQDWCWCGSYRPWTAPGCSAGAAADNGGDKSREAAGVSAGPDGHQRQEQLQQEEQARVEGQRQWQEHRPKRGKGNGQGARASAQARAASPTESPMAAGRAGKTSSHDRTKGGAAAESVAAARYFPPEADEHSAREPDQPPAGDSEDSGVQPSGVSHSGAKQLPGRRQPSVMAAHDTDLEFWHPNFDSELLDQQAGYSESARSSQATNDSTIHPSNGSASITSIQHHQSSWGSELRYAHDDKLPSKSVEVTTEQVSCAGNWNDRRQALEAWAKNQIVRPSYLDT